jgi:DNA/RNA endonuclease YhcR with UshA esterase domain
MNVLSSLALLAATCGTLLAEDTPTNAPAKGTNAPVKITAAEAKNHIGDEAIVTGVVAEVNKAEKLVRLNLDQPFPKQPITAVVFSTRTNAFGDLEKLKGKKVEVTGKIAAYRDRPQIVLTETNQFKVLEGSESGKPSKE